MVRAEVLATPSLAGEIQRDASEIRAFERMWEASRPPPAVVATFRATLAGP